MEHTYSSFASDDSGYESGITEVFDCGAARPKYENHEYARDIARQRQHAIAAQLSRLDADEYQHDILEHMMQMEVSYLNLQVLD